MRPETPPGEEPTCRILLVEDDDDDAELLAWALRRQAMRCAVSRAADLEECVQACREHVFDVVLLDLGLPGTTGFECLEAIHAATPGLPVVILTGLDDPETADRALGAGAAGYAVKGGDITELCRLVRTVAPLRLPPPPRAGSPAEDGDAAEIT